MQRADVARMGYDAVMIADVVIGSMRRARARIDRDALAACKYDARGRPLRGRRAELEALAAMGAREPSLGRIYEAHATATQLVALYGNATQRELAHHDVDCGELFALWHGEEASPVRIERRGDACMLGGTKTWACAADSATRALITARRSDGLVQLCLVPLDRCHVLVDDTGWHPIGLAGSNCFRVCFDGIEITTGDLIGAPGDYERNPWLLGGALAGAAVQTGIIERIARETIEYLRCRNGATDPHRHGRLGSLRMAAQSARNWLRTGQEAWSEYDAAPSEAAANRVIDAVDMARIGVERAAHDAIELASRCIGPAGLLRPLPFAQLLADLHMYLCLPGADDVLARVGETGLLRTLAERPAAAALP